MSSHPGMGEWHKASTAQFNFPNCPGFKPCQRWEDVFSVNVSKRCEMAAPHRTGSQTEWRCWLSQQGLCPAGHRAGKAQDLQLRSARGPGLQIDLQRWGTVRSIVMKPSQECDRRPRTGLVTVDKVKWCPLINKQDCRVETKLRSSWEVVHGSGSGSMCSMARHRHGCDRAVNRHTIKPAQTGSKAPELTWNGTPVPTGVGGSLRLSYSTSFRPFGILGALRNFD